MFTVVSTALCSLIQFGGNFLALPYPAVWAVFLCIFLIVALIFSKYCELVVYREILTKPGLSIVSWCCREG